MLLTSLRDDAALNDTNNDGAATLPAKGDWGCVFFAEGSDDNSCRMQWVNLRYGGSDSLDFSSRIGAVRLDNASPTLANLDMRDNWVNAVEIPAGDWRTDTWDNTSVIYFITGALRIPNGQTLTVAPGVVIKVLNPVSPTTRPYIQVQGALQVGALGGAAVTIASGRDDSVGPEGFPNWDSNGDGTSSAPEIGDWQGIVFESLADGTSSFVRNTTISYGGVRLGTFQAPYGALRFQGVNGSVEGCTFLENYRGVEALDGALPSISQCRFEGNEAYAVYNGSPALGTVSAANNWWGDATGPRSDGQGCNGATGYGDPVSCGVGFTPWLTVRP